MSVFNHAFSVKAFDGRKIVLETSLIRQLELETSIDIDSDAFSLTIPNPYGKRLVYKYLLTADRIKLYRANNEIFTGIIDDIDVSSDESGTSCNIQGRDLIALLIDSDAVAKTFSSATAGGIIKSLAGEFMTDFALCETKALKEFIVEEGESVWDACFRAARKFPELYLWCEPRGLVMDRLRFLDSPSYFFADHDIKGYTLVKNPKVTVSNTQRVSELIVKGKSTLQDETEFEEKIIDSTFPFKRRRIIADSDITSRDEAKKRAGDELKAAKVGYFEVTLTIPGLHDVAINRVAQVNLSRVGINDKLYILGANYRFDVNSGGETVIRLRDRYAALNISADMSTTSSAISENEEFKRIASSNPDLTGAGSKIVNEAMKHIGEPYLWGAAGPDKFDCSGLCQYVFKKALGISIPRHSSNQITEALRKVKNSELLPGDIIGFDGGSKDKTINHVGIYIGNNKMIEAPGRGKLVRYATVSARTDFLGAARWW
jgi:cell wall-associated NlpC family hydrolase